MKGEVLTIDYKTAVDFLLPKHYSGRVPSISWAFGWFVNKELVAVCTFGKPASSNLCDGIAGKENSKIVYELNRLCRVESLDEQLSQFVSACLRRLKPYNLIIVSYSDVSMNHNGYIYQACNFLYTGQTKQRTDKYTEGNKHSRHYDKNAVETHRKVRSAKNRYFYICALNKTIKKKLLSSIKYPILDYPKMENKNYVLGQYQKPVVIDIEMAFKERNRE